MEDYTNETFTNYAICKQIPNIFNEAIITNYGCITLTDKELEKLKIFLEDLLAKRLQNDNK